MTWRRVDHVAQQKKTHLLFNLSLGLCFLGEQVSFKDDWEQSDKDICPSSDAEGDFCVLISAWWSCWCNIRSSPRLNDTSSQNGPVTMSLNSAESDNYGDQKVRNSETQPAKMNFFQRLRYVRLQYCRSHQNKNIQRFLPLLDLDLREKLLHVLWRHQESILDHCQSSWACVPLQVKPMSLSAFWFRSWTKLHSFFFLVSWEGRRNARDDGSCYVRILACGASWSILLRSFLFITKNVWIVRNAWCTLRCSVLKAVNFDWLFSRICF